MKFIKALLKIKRRLNKLANLKSKEKWIALKHKKIVRAFSLSNR